MGTPVTNTGHSLAHLIFEISKGTVEGHSVVNKFGSNYGIDTGTTPEDIWTHGGQWVPPTQARIHTLVSTGANAAQDTGTVLSTGIATSGSEDKLIDSTATFSSDGVAAGDLVINAARTKHYYVLSVDSETQITLTSSESNHEDFVSGDSYKVVTAGGTGAAVVLIDRGLDSDFNEVSEYVVLNGGTGVPTVGSYTRINRMSVVLAASYDASNKGTITATAAVDGTVTAEIVNDTLHPNGAGQTLMGIYTVPAGHTAFMIDFYFSTNRLTTTAGAMADVSLKSRPNADVSTSPYQEKFHGGVSLTGNSHIERAYQAWVKYSEKTDIVMYCDDVTDSSTGVSGGFDLILVENSHL